MSKLYPPTIDTPLAAFYDASALTIPIIDNKTVSKSEIGGYKIKIKHVASGNIIAEAESDTTTFDLTGKKIEPGTDYKIQIAYIEAKTNTEGYYSSVAVIRYTNEPSFTTEEKNNHLIVTYENKDKDEKILEYRFTLSRQKTGQIVEDTGFLLHKRESDALEEYEEDGQTKVKIRSVDQFQISEDLNEDDLFNLVYTYRTIDNLEGTLEHEIMGLPKASCKIFQEGLVNLKATQDRENGAVVLKIHFDESAMNIRNGSYLVKRAKIEQGTTRSQLDDIYPWESVYGFNLTSQNVTQDIIWRDLTVANGESYVYSLCQFNSNGVYSVKIYSNIIVPKFDYMYLYDGQRQLAIKYNPEMSSFKNDILEQKIETIGRKYPFIYRNGIVRYKEFPIGGLLAESLDPDNLFYWKKKDEEKARTSTNSDEYSVKNKDIYYAEKVFKLEVLEWLTNGKPKLFRSITEGNYLVQLINVSLSPEEKLGRMLHKFSSTAYEIADLTDENLRNYGIINYQNEAINGQSVETYSQYYDLSKLASGENTIIPLNNQTTLTNIGIYITGARPMTHLKIRINDESEAKDYYIGFTGNFVLEPGQFDIKEFIIDNDLNGQPLMGTLNLVATGISNIDFYLISEVVRDPTLYIKQVSGSTNENVLNQLTNTGNQDIRYIAKLQIFRKYNLDVTNYNYKAKIKFADNNKEVEIDMSSRDIYEMNNITKMSSMILGNGLNAIFYYRIVTTNYSDGRS